MSKKLIHFVANCSNCSWETGDFLDGPEEAKDHAQNHKHKVTAEYGYFDTFDHLKGNKLKGGA